MLGSWKHKVEALNFHSDSLSSSLPPLCSEWYFLSGRWTWRQMMSSLRSILWAWRSFTSAHCFVENQEISKGSIISKQISDSKLDSRIIVQARLPCGCGFYSATSVSPEPQTRRTGFLCPEFLLSTQINVGTIFSDGKAWRRTRFCWRKGRIKSSLCDMLFKMLRKYS